MGKSGEGPALEELLPYSRERGTHQDLMRQRGLYYELVLKQDLERNREDD